MLCSSPATKLTKPRTIATGCQSRRHYESALGLSSTSAYASGNYTTTNYKLISSASDVDAAVDSIWADMKAKGQYIIGLDIEHNTTMTNKQQLGERQANGDSAVLSLAVDKATYVFRVCRFESLPGSLSDLLASDSVAKVGVGIKGDVTNLTRKFRGCHVNNVHEINELAGRKLGHTGSLASLCLEVLNKQLLKDNEFRLYTDWEADELSPDAVEYAAGETANTALSTELCRPPPREPNQRPSKRRPALAKLTALAHTKLTTCPHAITRYTRKPMQTFPWSCTFR